MAESVGLKALEPGALDAIVAEVGRALGHRATIALRLVELQKLADLSRDSFAGDAGLALDDGSGWLHERLAERALSPAILNYLSVSANRRRARETARRRLSDVRQA
jgi:hypothetical protein